MENRVNHNPRRIVLRGGDLPALLMGSTFIDLRGIAENCREHGLEIEFYQQRGVQGNFNAPSRFFIGRDSSEISRDVLEDGFDYRIELCECMPELRHMHNPDELQRFARNLRRGEPREGTCYEDGAGEFISSSPSFRIYRFEMRPPFSEVFIREAHGGEAAQCLSSLIQRYVLHHDRDLPRNVRYATDDLFNRLNSC